MLEVLAGAIKPERNRKQERKNKRGGGKERRERRDGGKEGGRKEEKEKRKKKKRKRGGRGREGKEGRGIQIRTEKRQLIANDMIVYTEHPKHSLKLITEFSFRIQDQHKNQLHFYIQTMSM